MPLINRKEHITEELLSKALQLDEEALAVIFEAYREPIFAYLYRRTSDPWLSEDMTSTVFLKMIESIRNGSGWTTSFSGWLYRIAHNLIIDWYRAKTRWTLTGIDDFLNMVDPRDCPEKAYERQEQSELLERAMRYLTEGQRAVMKLRFMDGYSFLEIAETMENTEGAVRALQHRGLVAMRSVIVPLEGA